MAFCIFFLYIEIIFILLIYFGVFMGLNIHTNSITDLYKSNQIVCVTTNGVLNKDGKNIMGKGNAGAMAKLLPFLPYKMGMFLKLYGHNVGFIWKGIISFPTKPEFGTIEDALPFYRDRYGNNPNVKVPGYWCKSSIDLVRKSMDQLNQLVTMYELSNVYLPIPGVGNGQLTMEEINPILLTSVPQIHLITNDGFR
jgi:hypothetical protein